MKDLSAILQLITATLVLLKVNPEKQTRKNLKHARRNYKRIRKFMKKDGISEKERGQLEEMVDLLVEAQYKLLKG